MSKRGKKVGASKLAEKRLNIRDSLWEDEIESLKIWSRTTHDGFTTVPRTLPYVFKVMDHLAGKGKPVSSTYFTLWCNVFDEGYLDIKDKERFAYESGFSGERAVTTWSGRMKLLVENGFIKAKEGTSGDFNHVLILNPLEVIKEIYKEKPKDKSYNALISRMNEVGATFEE
ncbi:hypothetical protein [Grimontia hollisae]|uniref:hypothetical protein n=1 Tax=Grimontia hollisae TaxID=673 RepID=UPI00058E18AB|nr:hypothetical protein [Grimontia hollisae]STO79489.1 Uncharacterised protein [Grimontia hollisae]